MKLRRRVERAEKLGGAESSDQTLEPVVRKTVIVLPLPPKLLSKKRLDVIRKVWHTKSIRCPECGETMIVIAIIWSRLADSYARLRKLANRL
jgi:hypothetical protein